MSCCNKAVPTVVVQSVTSAAGVTTFTTLPFSGALGRCNRFNLKNCFCLPNLDAGNRIVITDGSSTYDVFTKNGNYLRVNQIIGCCKQRKCLHMILGTDPIHVTICDELPAGCSEVLTPILTNPVTNTQSSSITPKEGLLGGK